MSDDRPSPPDAAARRRIIEDLDTSLLVEAGAGAGKTTQLVNRMIALVRAGKATPDQIAAVTFTRKAAAELRERFQAALERDLRNADPADPARAPLAAAIDRIDHAFLGTIHAFAARILRERPIEAGLDPAFEEVLEAEAFQDARRFWQGYLERMAADGDPTLLALSEIGIQAADLEGTFHVLNENLDVTFPTAEESLPTLEEIAPVRRKLEALIDAGAALLPPREPASGWGTTQRRVRSALYTRRHYGWDDRSVFFSSLYQFRVASHEFTLRRWAEPVTPEVKAYREAVRKLHADDEALELVERWLAHRYPAALRFALNAAEAFRDERRRRGRLTFQDLLTVTADLLRRDARARRDLGRRYRWLLVDEFQDTDPLQAEILFLLASEPMPSDSGDEPVDWSGVVIRPGALFLVGDPKQSIYRFRRADIAVYNQVRTRMQTLDALVGLEANFRSLPPIADLVNDVFPHLFPEMGSAYQAPFAPLRPQRRDSGGSPGVLTYVHRYKRAWGEAQAEQDAGRVASWIARRVAQGERSPGDFLVLVGRKKHLARYARALEDRRLPVDVSGAGVGFEQELQELLVLLDALIDPDDGTRIVAALSGLFFGIDADQLVRHRLSDGAFRLPRDPEAVPAVADPAAPDPIHSALTRLARWRSWSVREPADVFVGRLIEEVGLFPYAAAGPLGGLRAGALEYVQDVLRATSAAGDTSLLGAVEAIRTALTWEEAEAPLDPGRRDAVRVMNLHKAKGLQAPVVVLAEPARVYRPPATFHVARTARGESLGYLEIQRREGRQGLPLARPLQWRELQAEEGRFDEAETHRLLYVAATRAEDELLVASAPEKPDASPWGKLESWLAGHATPVVAPIELVGGPQLATATLEGLTHAVRSAHVARASAARPRVVFSSVSDLSKHRVDQLSWEEVPVPAGPADPAVVSRGYEWGSVVHAALASTARMSNARAIRALAASLLREFERPLLEDGTPRELDELVDLIGHVRGSPLWHRAGAAERVMVEAPFARRIEGADGEPDAIVEGVIDLAFLEAGEWVIADYKTDLGDDPDFPERVAAYRRQVDLYAAHWSQLTAQSVKERILYFTASGDTVTW